VRTPDSPWYTGVNPVYLFEKFAQPGEIVAVIRARCYNLEQRKEARFVGWRCVTERFLTLLLLPSCKDISRSTILARQRNVVVAALPRRSVL
jgi:hypothetical protein